jgi:hypothetical protein
MPRAKRAAHPPEASSPARSSARLHPPLEDHEGDEGHSRRQHDNLGILSHLPHQHTAYSWREVIESGDMGKDLNLMITEGALKEAD